MPVIQICRCEYIRENRPTRHRLQDGPQRLRNGDVNGRPDPHVQPGTGRPTGRSEISGMTPRFHSANTNVGLTGYQVMSPSWTFNAVTLLITALYWFEMFPISSLYSRRRRSPLSAIARKGAVALCAQTRTVSTSTDVGKMRWSAMPVRIVFATVSGRAESGKSSVSATILGSSSYSG